MENKINIAELLKDCPKGMELDCLLCNSPIALEGVAVNESKYPIKAVCKDGFIHVLTKYGTLYNHDDAKCVIFPKGKTTWEGFVPPFKFKDGDIVTWKDEGSLVACIYKERKMTSSFYHHIALYRGGIGIIINSEIALMDNQLRLATEKKKQKLFKAIKDNGYKWNAETKTLENLIEPDPNTIAFNLQPYKEETEKTDKALAPDLKGQDYSGRRFGYKIPNGYEFECVRKNEIILKPIKPKYPKTYKECCEVLGLNTMDNDAQGYKEFLIICFQELLIARNAYWKIAGKMMGLGKPWNPDWTNTNSNKYCIYYVGDEIKKQPMLEVHHFLAFPTQEMQDDFYENFKDSIKGCKELL